jgi:hypothetical protein
MNAISCMLTDFGAGQFVVYLDVTLEHRLAYASRNFANGKYFISRVGQ